MKIVYYGHSSFAAEINGKHLLFDPFVTQNPLAEAVDIKKIKADYIFVSHAHYDHITDAAAIADRTGATVISNYEVISPAVSWSSPRMPIFITPATPPSRWI